MTFLLFQVILSVEACSWGEVIFLWKTKMIKLNRESGNPLYLQLADEIRRRILDGTFTPNHRFPDEPAFSREVGVSRVTLRSAFAILQREGFAAA